MTTSSGALALLLGTAMVVFGRDPFTSSKCDINNHGTTDVADVQGMINEALGVASPSDDLGNHGEVNVLDVQIDINAALNLGCSADPNFGAAPTITDFNPKSAPVGTLVTITGTNLKTSSGVAQVILAQQGGGTIGGPISTAAATTLTFVIPAGAATGAVTVTANGNSASSSTPLTIVPSSSFSVTAGPGSANLIQGQSISYSVNLTSSGTFSQLAALSVSGVPSGATATFAPAQITLGQSSTLTVSAPTGQPTGPSTLTVTAAAKVDGIPVTSSANATLNVTAVSTSFLGRTVIDNTTNTPLAGVTVSMVGQNGGGQATGCTGSTTSDASGNFALTNLPASCLGPQLIGFNGNTVTSPPGVYAGLQLVFTLVVNTVVVSPVLVHLPQVNNVETFNVIQNDTVDQTYSFQSIPGLSVTVYARTVFTEQDNSQPNPFPLAAINVPVDRLPDVMPTTTAGVTAFIVAFQPAETNASQAVAVSFPNTLNAAPGTDMPLMTLDPTLGRMVPYGTGTVSNDGKTIIPDINPAASPHRYGIVHFDWHGPDGGPGNEDDPPPDPDSPDDGDPVNLATGISVLTSTDIAITGTRGSVALTRTYRSGAAQGNIPGPFGWGSFHNFEYRLDTLTPQSASVINLILPTGTRIPFNLQADGTLINTTVPLVAGWVMTTSSDGTTTLRQKTGIYYRFVPGIPPTGSVLVGIGDPNGNVTTIVRVPGAPYQVSEIDDPVGRKLLFQYNGETISQITDPIGRTVSYTYNPAGYLATYTNVLGGVTQYQYDSNGNVTQITDPRGVTVSTTYDTNGRVHTQTLPSGGTLKFAYTLVNSLVPTSPVTQTVVTDPLGNATTYRFNTNGYLVAVTDALGQTRSFNRQFGTNLLTSITGNGTCNACGNVLAGNVTYTYDASGNKLSETDGLGNTTAYTYDSVYNRITSIRDKSGNITQFAYDSHANLLKVTNPRGNNTTFTYAPSGLITSLTDESGQNTAFTYDSLGNTIKITDALGNTAQLAHDGISRQIAQLDALGGSSSITYNPMSEPTQVVEANGRTTKLTYDLAGYVKSYTDPNGGTVSFGYDSAGRRATRTDQLGAVTTFGYDTMSNIVSFTNRRGQSATYSYDALNRLTGETYVDATVTRTYDANSRLKQVVDSASGTFSYGYDAIGNLLQQIGPFGAVDYTRDKNGRATTRQVGGDPQVTYTYDPDGNLTNASMTGASVAQTFDVRDHLSGVSRSNGVNGTYTYDLAGRLLSIAERNGSTSLVSRGYAYDPVGRVVSQAEEGGLPLATPASTSTFNSDSEIVTGGALSSTFTTDADGNRLTDVSAGGTTSYTWDARGRLKSLSSGGAVTSFLYDFNGNLIQKSVTQSGSSTVEQYILDDLTNVVKQNNVGVGSVSLLTGRRIDQTFALVSGGSPVFPLADILTSTVALTDGSANVTGHAYYEPYGKTTESGATDLLEFTSRQQAAQDLYYLRFRYLDARNGRYISQDPQGIAGGDPDLYRYVGNSPASSLDPNGLATLSVGGTINLHLGFANFQGFAGVAVDGQGGFGWYWGYGAGGGVGADVGGGVQAAISNGDSIKDLGGPFVNGSVNAGAGLGGSIDGFAGKGSHGQPIVGGGVTAGVGAGADWAVDVTNTHVHRIW